MSSPSITIQFAGHALLLDPSGALYWPSERVLIASDLHFEKGSFLARHGSLIPPYDTQHTLERLEALVQQYAPRQLILLGDSFHDRAAWLRLDQNLRERILALGARTPCLWIEGNHDVVLEAHGLGEFLEQYEFGGITLTHEPISGDTPQIFGHYHPAFSLAAPVRIRGRCFVQAATRLAMPSFGSYTGGLDIRDPAFCEAIGEREQVYLLHGNKVHALPKPKPRPRHRFRNWQ